MRPAPAEPVREDRPGQPRPQRAQDARGARRAGRIRRLGPVVAVAVVTVLAAAGCHPDNTPTAYGPDVQTAFLQTCTGNIPNDTTIVLATDNFCNCAYQVFVDNVPYNKDDKDNRDNGKFANYPGEVFVDVNNDLGNDPNKWNDNSVVPQNIRDMVNACPQVGATQLPTGGSNGTTPGTTPGTSSGTTSGTTPGNTGTTTAGSGTTGTTSSGSGK
jgi:hypothetical protein